MIPSNNILTCATGEHYIAFRLSLRGCSVAIPRCGTTAVDLLATNSRGDKTISIQVKTSNDAYRERKRNPENSHWEWDVGTRATELSSKNYVYTFVDLGPEHPDVFIVPSEVVKKFFEHPEEFGRFMFWINVNDKDKYLNRWDFIEKLLK